MTPTLSLFKKEFHQHGIFAPAMVVMCLLFQVAYSQLCYFSNVTVDVQTYFSLAIVLTALYAGAAAALAYSTEHADNTFIFLRKMPISPTTIALGKTGWVVFGTLLVLLGYLILALIWTGGYLDSQIASAFGFGIVEALVWGLFWSTRCRNQVHALLGGYLCAVGTLALLGNIVQAGNPAVVDVYIALMPYRTIVVLIVGILAIRGMLRWFKYESKPSILTWFFPGKVTIRYPQGIQTPFFALVHQHIRHASLIYPVGVLCFIALTLVFSFFWIVTVVDPNGWNSDMMKFTHTYRWECQCCLIICIAGMVLFWATIFGHDQKNHSYRFLSRLGIHEGQVWWSRLLPALVLYSPVLFSYLGWMITDISKNIVAGNEVLILSEVWRRFIPTALAIWLTPVAVGAFVSISMRSQMVAIALTAIGISLPLFWVVGSTTFLGCSPWWSTLPIVIALLVASRIRAAYWLRETFTWRSRFIPLIPVLGVSLVVMLAIPPVRMYSIPDVSWEQIEGYFGKINLPERPEPEKLAALLKLVKEKRDVTLGNIYPDNWGFFSAHEAVTYEEYVLLMYDSYRRAYDRSLAEMLKLRRDRNSRQFYSGQSLFRVLWCYSPWERARADRSLRLYIVAALVRSCGLQDEKAKALGRSYERLPRTVSDNFYMPRYDTPFENIQCLRRLQKVVEAMETWYQERGALPASLGDLVGIKLADTSGTNLDAIPVHPFTRALVEYHVNSPPVENLSYNMRYNTYVFNLGAKGQVLEFGTIMGGRLLHSSDAHMTLNRSGGTYLRLGDVIVVIKE